MDAGNVDPGPGTTVETIGLLIPSPWRSILLGRAFGDILRLLYGGYGRGLRQPPKGIRMSQHGGRASRCDQGATPDRSTCSVIRARPLGRLTDLSRGSAVLQTPWRSLSNPRAADRRCELRWYVDSRSRSEEVLCADPFSS